MILPKITLKSKASTFKITCLDPQVDSANVDLKRGKWQKVDPITCDKQLSPTSSQIQLHIAQQVTFITVIMLF